MKKIITGIILLISLSVSSQSNGVVLETKTFDTTNDYRKISYKKSMDIRYDKDWGKFYNTLYKVYENGNNKVAEIAVSNYKDKGIIEVYVMPCNNGKIVDDMITGFEVKSSEFNGITYSKNFKEKLADKKELKISYVSNKKEHLKINEVNYNPFNLHYKISN
ncbi:MAG: hypothetical protein AB8B65_13930 [Kordia sp.]|uniref:hypothetical protein n=1 Tax=Kordia sp. TaxID=1965332 RepID=UPI00385F05ED